MNKKPKKNLVYCIAYIVLWVVFRIVMPTRCINKGNRPKGGALLCANHTRTNDPLFIAYALGWRYQIHVMAKEEIMHWPFIGWVLRHGVVVLLGGLAPLRHLGIVCLAEHHGIPPEESFFRR